MQILGQLLPVFAPDLQSVRLGSDGPRKVSEPDLFAREKNFFRVAPEENLIGRYRRRQISFEVGHCILGCVALHGAMDVLLPGLLL